MNYGIIGKALNKYTVDGGLTAPQVSNEFFYDPNSMFGKFMALLEKLLTKLKKFWDESSRKISKAVRDLKVRLSKMFGNGPVKVQVSSLFYGFATDEGMISANHFKHEFSEIGRVYQNLLASLQTSYFQPNPDAIMGKIRLGVSESTKKLAELKSKIDAHQSEEKHDIEVAGTDLKQLDKILDICDAFAPGKGADRVTAEKDFAKIHKQIVDTDGEAAAKELFLEVLAAQQTLLGNLENATRQMFRVINAVIGTSEKLATDDPKASNENFEDTVDVECPPIAVVDTPAETMYEDLLMVSNEAAMAGNLQNYFSRKADLINMSVREGFRYLTTMNYNPMEQLNPMQMESLVSGMVFEDHENVKVDQPTGFKGELLPYTTGLVARANVMTQVLNEVIRPAASRFGHYLSIPMDRAERRDFEAGVMINVPLEQLIKDDAEYFAANRQGSASLGKLFTSFREFIESERNMTEVNAILSGGNTSEVKKAVDALSITATALIKRLGEDKQNKPSNEFATMIGEQLTEVAKWVEWYSVQMTRIIETNNCLYAIEKEIRKL